MKPGSVLRQMISMTLFVSFLVGCGASSATLEIERQYVTIPSAQRTVDAVVALRMDLPSFAHLRQKDAVKTGDEFDVNEYFIVLNHLSVQPGFVLDYVYLYGHCYGWPVLYARPEGQSPYLTYSEYVDAGNPLPPESEDKYLEKIQVDDTAEGFFQFVVLHIMGGHFYLWADSHYREDQVVSAHERLEEILPPELQQEASSLEIEARVKMEDDRVLVRVMTFSRWGGLRKREYTISRSFPHRILERDVETLVPYDCGVEYGC